MLVCFTMALFYVLNAILERFTIYFHRLPYALPLMLPYFYGSFVPFHIVHYYY